MQVVSKKKEKSRSRKLELQEEKSTLEKQVQGRDEHLENVKMQLEVGCLHHAVCISSVVTPSSSVCACCRCVCCQY